MKKLLVISLALVFGIICLNAQEQEISLTSFKGIDCCLQKGASKLAEQVPHTLKEKTALFIERHEEKISLGLVAPIIYFGLHAGTCRNFDKELHSCDIGFGESLVSITKTLVISFGARALLDKIKGISVLSKKIEAHEAILKRNSSALDWASKQIEEFFSVDAKGSNISCNDRGKFLESLKNSISNGADIESSINSLDRFILPTLQLLTDDLDDLSHRLDADDVRHEEFNELSNELYLNRMTIEVLLGNADGFEELVEIDCFQQDWGEDIQALFNDAQ